MSPRFPWVRLFLLELWTCSQLNPFFLNLFAAHLENRVFSKAVTSYIWFTYYFWVITVMGARIVIYLQHFIFYIFIQDSLSGQCPPRTVLGAALLIFLHSFNHERSRMIPPTHKFLSFPKNPCSNCSTQIVYILLFSGHFTFMYVSIHFLPTGWHSSSISH